MLEKNFMPSIDNIQIIPPEGKTLSEKEKHKRREKRESGDSLSNFIFKWWKGDTHTHSKESTRPDFGYVEGLYDDINEVIEYYGRIGLKFVSFADHASKPGSPKKQSPDSEISQSLLKQAERITRVNKENKSDCVAFSGVETNIFFDDNNQITLDLPDEVLEKLDLVISSRHCVSADEKIHALKEKDPQSIKESLLFAINSGKVDIIGHPDRYTRNDKEKSPVYWQEYWNIWPEILQEMARNHVAFEINLNNPPENKLIEMAAKVGVKFSISYDAHDFNTYKKFEGKLMKQIRASEDKLKDEKATEEEIKEAKNFLEKYKETIEFLSLLTEKGEQAKKQWAEGKTTEEGLQILKEYKTTRLSAGPGVRAILKLVSWIKKMESLEITPDRIINSSQYNLIKFLTEDRKKTTENLKNLRKV